MAKHPLAEVFGFPTDNFSEEAIRHREHRLCPFNNRIPNCTKVSAENPLGVCSIFSKAETPVITCPIRFREDWQIASDAANFFFPLGTKWTSLTEVALLDKHNREAGNIDVVLVSYDENHIVTGYGALEIQAVYVSGNIRNPFACYMNNPVEQFDMDWSKQKHYPRPDYLSSSRKRLGPQLLFKGGILHSWGRRMAVAMDRNFYETLPPLKEVDRIEAEIAWLVYELRFCAEKQRYRLALHQILYTKFESALHQFTHSEAGNEFQFLETLQKNLKQRLGL